MKNVTNKKWELAQVKERTFHQLAPVKGVPIFEESYTQYFQYLNIDFDLKGLSICEIGPADYSALRYCYNFNASVIIEPMVSSILDNWVKPFKNITLIRDKAENCLENVQTDEVWLMNVLQHTQDPDKIIRLAKKVAKVVRFFEPINCDIDVCHFHTFTLTYFQEHFGEECVQYYPSHRSAVKFHSHECAYGVWVKTN